MLKLEGVIPSDIIHNTYEYTKLRFRDSGKYKTPEALTLYEQNWLDYSTIKSLIEKEYGYVLNEPIKSYVPEDIIRLFGTSEAVPISFRPMSNVIQAVYIPEIGYTEVESKLYTIEYVPTTICYYMDAYLKTYGRHKDLQDIPSKMLMDFIVDEAINLGAADITISSVGRACEVYYNVRKRKVQSNRVFEYEGLIDIIKYLCIKSPYDFGTRTPKYVDVDLNSEYRGRVVINSKFGGYTITIRILPNKAFDNTLVSLNLTEKTAAWIKKNFLDMDKGLRLVVGETMSGKNTLNLAALKLVADSGRYKIVSVEMPVEQRLPGVEQINTETVEEYDNNIKSLIHQNPDFVYITEIRDSTGLSTIQITNTGKRVLSTLHANSVADTISRLVDITKLSTDRVIQNLHSIVYQQLVRDDEKDIVYPRDRYVRFTDDLKYRLYGKSLGEIIRIIREEEDGDEWINS